MRSEIILILGMAIVTILTRYPLLAALSKVSLPTGFKTALEYVPPAVLTAIIVPEVLAPGGTPTITFSNPALIASIAAVVISWRTKNLLATILGGMAVYYLWPILLSAL